MDAEIEEIIEDFTNDKRTNSSYTISSNSDNSDDFSLETNKNIELNLLSRKKNDEFLFYNNVYLGRHFL